MTFGLKEYDEIKGKDIADYFGIDRTGELESELQLQNES